jgi:glycosyltransferase involved in cell wall biosynthesis
MFSVYGLCNALASMPGMQLEVLTTDSAGPRWDQRVDVGRFPWTSPAGYPVYHCRRLWGISVSPGLFRRLAPMVRAADVVHLTSAYSFPTIPTLLLCRIFGKPVVWSPRGQLQRWEGSTRPALKRIWEMVCNRLLSPQRSALHVTSQSEAEESRRRVARARVEIVGNGVEIPPVLGERAWRPDGMLRLLYIGRLHPKKGIENLLQALGALDDNVTLIVCGAGEPAYETSLKNLVNTLGLRTRVRFQGHVEGERKSNAFRETDICVVPSYTENFAMVVAEALAHGVPVIASRGTPWKELVQRDCGLWVENDPASLVKAVTEIRNRNLSQMGSNGRQWMQDSFSWEVVAARMHVIYRSLVGETKD